MNDHKICFIMCSNNEFLARECQIYIEQLLVPDGYEVGVLTVTGAESMTAGYNEGMNASDAKYKVYLHQDVLLINPGFLYDLLELFRKYPDIGMFGVVGNESIAEDGGMWTDGPWRRTGELLTDNIFEYSYSLFKKVEGDYAEVIALDGLLMVTQYDVPWREDLFQGWDFYDASQSVEFWRAGYKVVVPHMNVPWCLHDNDIVNVGKYAIWKDVFVGEYKPFYTEWMRERGRLAGETR